MMNQNLLEQLKKHEGFRGDVYKCTAGANTIGYGRNLDAKPLTPSEAEYLLKNDITYFIGRLNSEDLLEGHDEARQSVVINMCFNLGFNGLLAFKNTLQYYRDKKYEEAAAEMLNSRWARQVCGRAQELAAQMATGEWE